MAHEDDPDYLDTLTTDLDTDWDPANVAKPTIAKIYDLGSVDVHLDGDYVLTYETSRTMSPRSLGYLHEEVRSVISVDIRTGVDETRLWNLYDEVWRILAADRIDPGTGISYWRRLRLTPLINKQRRMWRVVLDVEAVTHAQAVA